MRRIEDIKAAIVDHLWWSLKAVPERPIDLYDVCVPLSARGFTPDELNIALNCLEVDGVIELISGNRLNVKKPLA